MFIQVLFSEKARKISWHIYTIINLGVTNIPNTKPDLIISPLEIDEKGFAYIPYSDEDKSKGVCGYVFADPDTLKNPEIQNVAIVVPIHLDIDSFQDGDKKVVGTGSFILAGAEDKEVMVYIGENGEEEEIEVVSEKPEVELKVVKNSEETETCYIIRGPAYRGQMTVTSALNSLGDIPEGAVIFALELPVLEERKLDVLNFTMVTKKIVKDKVWGFLGKTKVKTQNITLSLRIIRNSGIACVYFLDDLTSEGMMNVIVALPMLNDIMVESCGLKASPNALLEMNDLDGRNLFFVTDEIVTLNKKSPFVLLTLPWSKAFNLDYIVKAEGENLIQIPAELASPNQGTFLPPMVASFCLLSEPEVVEPVDPAEGLVDPPVVCAMPADVGDVYELEVTQLPAEIENIIGEIPEDIPFCMAVENFDYTWDVSAGLLSPEWIPADPSANFEDPLEYPAKPVNGSLYVEEDEDTDPNVPELALDEDGLGRVGEAVGNEELTADQRRKLEIKMKNGTAPDFEVTTEDGPGSVGEAVVREERTADQIQEREEGSAPDQEVVQVTVGQNEIVDPTAPEGEVVEEVEEVEEAELIEL